MHAHSLRRAFIPLLLACALLVPFSLTGCASKSSGDTPAVLADTTVLVYLIGSDLESRSNFASKNIAEMMEVGSTAGMKVVLQTGGAKQPGTEPGDTKAMSPEGINWTMVQRYLVQKGSIEQLEDLGPDVPGTKRDMGSPQTFKDFLTWGVGAFPAKRYIVVLWDHGGGVNEGVGPDEVTGTALPVAGTREALAAVSTDMEQKFMIVGFDTCLMGTAEVATSLATSAQFMVASEDIEPGPGWNYEAFLEFVAENPTATGDAIGIAIVDSYVTKSTREDPKYPVTLSVIDLSQSQALIDATDAFAAALAGYASTLVGWEQIAMARQRSLDWDTSAIFRMATDLVDMKSFVALVVQKIEANIGPDAVLAQAATDLTDAIDEAVLYAKGSGSDEGATGLTVYFPSVMPEFVDKDGSDSRTYATNTTAGGLPFFALSYTDGTTGLVRKYYDFYAANKTDLQATVTIGEDETNRFAATISNDFDYALASHRPTGSCKLYTGAKVASPFVLAPCYDGMQAVQGTPISELGEWQVDFRPGQTWPHIWDFPIVLVPDQVALNRAGEFATYLVPAFAYDEKDSEYDSGFLRVEVTLDANQAREYKVIGFQPHAVRASGKVYRLAWRQIYALGAYHWESGQFLRTDRTVFVEGTTLEIKEKLIGGGTFAYLVADLTGAIQSSAWIDYPAAIIEFTAASPSIATGGWTFLGWNVAGADSISIDQGLGPQSGTYVYVSPTVTTTYTLTATNKAGSVTKTATVTVVP